MSDKKEQYDAMISMMIGSSNTVNAKAKEKLRKALTDIISDIIEAEKISRSCPVKQSDVFCIQLKLHEVNGPTKINGPIRCWDVNFGLN